jgi:PAS domain S-box-containing protein
VWDCRNIGVSNPVDSRLTEDTFPEMRFQLLLDGVVDQAILALDADGLITTWNAGAERLKGHRPSEIIGQHVSVLYPPSDVAAGITAAELSEAIANGSAEVEGWRLRQDRKSAQRAQTVRRR